MNLTSFHPKRRGNAKTKTTAKLTSHLSCHQNIRIFFQNIRCDLKS